MYNLSYDFKQYNDIIATYMNVLIQNSNDLFIKQKNQGLASDRDNNGYFEAICTLEDYLHFYFERYPNNFNEILNSIINEVKTISCLPNNNRGIYGATVQNMIYINPDMRENNNLSGMERIRLYMAHELGHVVNKAWLDNGIECFRYQKNLGNIDENSFKLISEGLAMIDEVTTQDRAEEFTYASLSKVRPTQAYYRSQMFGGTPYKSNFDFYGELQGVGMMFAQTLRGIGDKDEEALNLLSKRALSSNFFDNFLDEYMRDNQVNNLITELKYMGCIKKASYASFGADDRFYLDNSSVYLENFKEIAGSLRDYREPYVK